jgi:hypothetical protein
MRTTILVAQILALFAAPDITVLTASAGDGDPYESAVVAAHSDGIDRSWQLRQCLRNWEGMKTKQAIDAVSSFATPAQSGELLVLLEIGSSSTMRHDFIFVRGSLLTSSFGNVQKSIRKSRVEADLRRFIENDLGALAGRSSSPVLDGNCYFLSVRKGGIRKVVALYGLLTEAKTDLLIRDLISTATEVR